MKCVPIKINHHQNGLFCLIPAPAHPSQEGINPPAAQTSSKQPILRATRNPFPREVQRHLGCPRASKCPLQAHLSSSPSAGTSQVPYFRAWNLLHPWSILGGKSCVLGRCCKGPTGWAVTQEELEGSTSDTGGDPKAQQAPAEPSSSELSSSGLCSLSKAAAGEGDREAAFAL